MDYGIWKNFISLMVTCSFFLPLLVTGGPGTTPNIEEIFLGRCYQYQEVPAHKLLKPHAKDCPLLWDTFKSAFAFKDPAAITRSDYQPFFDVARQTNIPVNKSVLWSGTYDIAHQYAAEGGRYVTMEDSLIGYLSNGLHWCGSVVDGINYTACPDWQDLPKQASQSFWGGASSTFAGSSTGEIRLVLKGSNPNRTAYDRSSFFANYELPSIQADKAMVIVILVNDVGQPAFLKELAGQFNDAFNETEFKEIPWILRTFHPVDVIAVSSEGEHCNTGSLVLLQEDMKHYGLEFYCQENPPDILHLLCVDKPTADDCKFSNRRQTSNIASLLNPKSKRLVG